MGLTKNQEKDYKKFFIEKGDSGFSPERNKTIIEDTIKKYEAERARRKRAFNDKVSERIDAIASFLGAVNKGKEPNINRYFGKRELARLRGQELIDQLRSALTVRNKQGKIIRPN